MAQEEFPLLESERLRLRKPGVRDLDRILEYADNPKIDEMTLSFPYPYREKDAISWLHKANKGFEKGTDYIFAICGRESDAFIGGVGLHLNKEYNRAELGFWLAEPYWGRGYMTEALRQVLHFGFHNLELHKIYAVHFTNNPASGRVMAKNGMVREAQLKEHIRKDGRYRDLVQYRLTKTEYERDKG